MMGDIFLEQREAESHQPQRHTPAPEIDYNEADIKMDKLRTQRNNLRKLTAHIPNFTLDEIINANRLRVYKERKAELQKVEDEIKELKKQMS